MSTPNQINPRSGMYRCIDCGYVVTVDKGSKFPRCPIHPHPASWHFVRPAEAHTHPMPR